VYAQPKKGGHPNIARCSPSLFHSFTQKIKTGRIVLNIAAHSLEDRDYLTWIMDHFNPENMTLEISGGKKIEVTEYAIKCMFDLPSERGDPPFVSNSQRSKL
jgi:hypothetical protein